VEIIVVLGRATPWKYFHQWCSTVYPHDSRIFSTVFVR